MNDAHRTAEAWLELQRNWWAHEKLEELCAESPRAAWTVVLAILDRADEEMAAQLGAGPLEDLIDAHPAALIEQVEAEAAQRPLLRTALGSVWLRGSDGPAAARYRSLGCRVVPVDEDAGPPAGRRS